MAGNGDLDRSGRGILAGSPERDAPGTGGIGSAQPGPSVVCVGTQYLYANALSMGSPEGPCLDGQANYGEPVADL